MNRQSAIGCLVLLVVISTVTTARASDLRYAIETAEVIQTFPLTGMEVLDGKLGRDVIGIQMTRGDSSIVAAYTFDGELLFWRSAPGDGRPVLLLSDVSDDGSTFVLKADSGQYDWYTVVLDADGREVCNLGPISGSVQASPGGRFFCPVPNTVEGPRFEVFDRRGDRHDIEVSYTWDWNARFLSDSAIALVSHSIFRLIDLSVGRVVDSMLIPLWMDESTFDFPFLSHESESPLVAVYTQRQLLVGSTTAQLRVHQLLDGYLSDVFFSQSPGWVVATLQDPEDSVRHFQILSTDGEGEGIRSAASAELWRGGLCTWCPDNGALRSGVISIQRFGTSWNPEAETPWTTFAEFDPDSLTITEPFRARGTYVPARGDAVPADTYLRVYPPDTVQLVRLNR